MDVEAAANMLAEYVPHFHACAVGPSPAGSDFHCRVALDMYVPSMAEAEESMPAQIEEMCRLGGVEFDPDDWVVVHLMPINQN